MGGSSLSLQACCSADCSDQDPRLLLPTHGQVQQQDASSEHASCYPGLSGKGLCARALYDYQAGKVLWPSCLGPLGQRSGDGETALGELEEPMGQGGGVGAPYSPGSLHAL